MKMRVYSALAAVLAASALTAALIPASDWVRALVLTPGIGAMLGALLQIFRDASQFERQQHLQTDQQLFSLGASSHMSTVAFDKHVAFCEAYMREVHETVGTLFREGPTAQAMGCAQKLFSLKREYAAWIPKQVALKLEPFENALHRLGVEYHLVNQLGSDDRETRSKAIEESYSLFRNLLELQPVDESDPEQKKREIAAENVKEEVRAILGINELVEIRTFIIQRSAAFARSHGGAS